VNVLRNLLNELQFAAKTLKNALSLVEVASVLSVVFARSMKYRIASFFSARSFVTKFFIRSSITEEFVMGNSDFFRYK
jgi:hypothetical protein